MNIRISRSETHTHTHTYQEVTITDGNKGPEREKRSAIIMASIDDAISTSTSIACPTSEVDVDADNNATDRGRKPLSCIKDNIASKKGENQYLKRRKREQ